MKKYRCKVETITPVHIGSGDEISPHHDFIYDSGYINLIDSQLLLGILGSHLDTYIDFLKTNHSHDSLKKFLKKNNIKYDLEKISRYKIPSVNLEGTGNNSTTSIALTIKNAGLPYIPGSTIKGAFRTAILYNLWKGRKLQDLDREIKKLGLRRDYIGQDKFGSFLDDIFKFFRVSDTQNFLKHKIVRAKRVHLINSDSNGIPQIIETIDEKDDSYLEIWFDDVKVDEYDKARRIFKNFDLKEIFKLLKEFYKEIFEKELEKNSDNLRIKEIYDLFKNLSDNEVLLRIGRGKTFWDNTIMKAFEENAVIDFMKKELEQKGDKKRQVSGKMFPITRTFIQNSANSKFEIPAGWVKITLLEENDGKEYFKSVYERIAKKRDELREKQVKKEREIKEEKKRREEEIARKQKEEEERRKKEEERKKMLESLDEVGKLIYQLENTNDIENKRRLSGELYNKLDEAEDKKKVAEVLKQALIDTGVWYKKKKSDRQKEKVEKIKEILGE